MVGSINRNYRIVIVVKVKIGEKKLRREAKEPEKIKELVNKRLKMNI